MKNLNMKHMTNELYTRSPNPLHIAEVNLPEKTKNTCHICKILKPDFSSISNADPRIFDSRADVFRL